MEERYGVALSSYIKSDFIEDCPTGRQKPLCDQIRRTFIHANNLKRASGLCFLTAYSASSIEDSAIFPFEKTRAPSSYSA
ncbi:MAG: hypothetical protein A4E44_00185 [Methanosaeta sp. PtaB.Bin018]|nr:MAG: hypothetical protein A4E44_00185 [Methanosaeta sp. PtaB.Bin018]